MTIRSNKGHILTTCSPRHIKLVPTNLYLLVMQVIIHRSTFFVEFWAAFNSLTDRSMFFDVKQLPDLKSGSRIYLGAVKQLRNSLSSCRNTSQNGQ